MAEHLLGTGARTDTRQLSKDFRVQILLKLASDGDIKYEDMENILNYTTENDPPEKIIGMLVGISDIAPKKVESALEGTEWATNSGEIESISKGFDEFVTDFDTKSRTFRDISLGWLGWPMGAIGKGWELAVGASVDQPKGLYEGYYGEEAEADRSDRTATRNAARDEIDRLAEGGYISTSEAERLRNRTGKYSAVDYEFLIDELNTIYEGMDPADRDQEYGSNRLLTQLESRRDSSGGATPNMTGGGNRRNPGASSTTEEDIVGPGDEGVTTIQVDGPDGDVSFAEYAALDPTGDAQDAPAARARASYFKDDAVYDRSTGQSYSFEEWDAIKRDPVMRARYEKAKNVSPAIQGTLDSLKDRGLPSINLSVPSLSPQEPWETTTFDFRAGDGRGQWLSMSNRERYSRVQQMKNEGLISQQQFDDMGATAGSWSGGGAGQGFYTAGSAGPALNLTAMNIWEQAIGLSSDTQKNPIAALSDLGRWNREAKATQGRGGGRGARPKYSVPASLREIPDYKTLATESKAIFESVVGRSMEDWELALAADELQQKYTSQQTERIGISKAAWNDAQAGGTVSVDFSEVEDPTKGAIFDIEEKYAGELDRQERVEDRANNNRLLLDSISTGRRMI